ncbi:MAG: MucBP domain-containing protein, partial [Clostridia bacterium]|nr:MucBP domain-containing protein [Clostridia bacterium]
VTDGWLKITPAEIEVAISGNTGTVTYSGNTEQVNGFDYTVSGSDAQKSNVTVALGSGKTAHAEGKDVKTADDGKYMMGLKPDGSDFTVTADANYTVKSVTVTDGWLKITPISSKVTVTITENSDEATYDGENHTISGYKSMVADNPLYVVADSVNETKTDDWTVTEKDAGTYDMGIVAADFANKNTNFTNVEFKVVDGQLQIGKRTVTLTSADGRKIYDGKALTKNAQTDVKVSGDGFVNDEGATYDITGSQTLVGSSDNVFTYELNAGTLAGNYEIKTVFGTLTVTDGTGDDEEDVPDELVVTKDDGSDEAYKLGDTVVWTVTVKNIYNEVKSLTVTEAEGMEIEDEVPQTLDAGQQITITVKHVVTAADVAAKSIKNEVTVQIGDLEKKGEDTVATDPIAIEITANSASKVYDGKALTDSGYKLTSGTLNTGNTIESVTVEGSQMLVGESKNVASSAKIVDAKGNDVTAGYAISYVEGKLTVTPVTDKVTVTITGNSGNATYDGTEKTVEGYTVSIDNALYTEADFTFSGTAAVKGTNAGNYDMALKADDFANISRNFTNVAFVIVDGKLEITAAVVTVKVEGKTKTYDNNPETDPELTAEVTGTVDGETISMTLIREPGQNAGEYAITVDEGSNPNYKLVIEPGTFMITPAAVTVKADNKTKVYDNNPETDPELTAAVTGTVAGDTISYTLGRTPGQNAGEYPITVTPGSNPNYKVTVEAGTFTITPAAVTVKVTGNTGTAVYNGTEQTVGGYTIETSNEMYTENDFGFNGSAIAAGTLAGTYPMVLDGGEFINRNPNFTVTFEMDTAESGLVIEPAELIITAGSAEKEFDGTELTEDSYTAEDLADEDVIESVTITGTQTEAGESDNIPSDAVIRNAAGEDVTESYLITYVNGTLTVTAPVQYRLTVRYWMDRIGGGEAAETFTALYHAGTEYNVTSPLMAGYNVSIERASGIITEDTTLDVVYTVNAYVLTINYVYANGTEAAPTYRVTLPFNAEYAVDSPAIGGYLRSLNRVNGRMPAQNVTYNVTYLLDGVIIDDYDTPLGLPSLSMATGESYE